jgi:hypothetical protein
MAAPTTKPDRTSQNAEDAKPEKIVAGVATFVRVAAAKKPSVATISGTSLRHERRSPEDQRRNGNGRSGDHAASTTFVMREANGLLC